MKMILLCILSILFIHFDELLASESQTTSNQEIIWKDIEPLINKSGKTYFNAANQIFHITVQSPKLSFNISDGATVAPETGLHEFSSTPKPVFKVPDGYTLTPGIGAHKFHSNSSSWNSARNICIEEGGHLLILRSADEENMIKEYQVNNNIKQIWLGVHDIFQYDDWMTVLDEPLRQLGYAPWLKGEPNNIGGIEHCAGYVIQQKYVGDGMNDRDCRLSFPFFCKIDLQ